VTQAKGQNRWTRPRIDAIKRAVKAELDQAAEGGQSKQRLSLALRRVAELENDVTPDGQIQRLIYVISSLVHHARYGGLSRAQVKKARDLANTILRTHGVLPGASRLDFLYGELHLILSQIYRKFGLQWQAAWEHQQALYRSRRSAGSHDGFEALGMGNRALRLGHAPLALSEFHRAETGDLPPSDLEKVRLGIAKTLRLSGDFTGAREALERLGATNLSDEARLEAAWEGHCLAAATERTLAPMIAAVRRHGTHRQGIYVLEASLWAKVAADREWLEKVMTVRSMAKHPDLRPQRFGFFYAAAGELDRCYDVGIPLPLRMEALGDVLAGSAKLTTVDKELLIWAAAARFLARSHAHSHAALALSEYVSLSLKLSGGRSRDALGLMGDMCERDWFHNDVSERAS
jgi:hypothetical protein